MMALLANLVRDERGQDLVEYALLTAVIGLVCVACFDLLKSAIQNVYTSWTNDTTGANSAWETPDPASGS